LTGLEIVSRAKDALQGNLVGPMAKDMPYTPYTDSTLERLAALKPRFLAVMHGSSFEGNGQQAILDLAVAIRGFLGKPAPGS
jgi:hypothetical protein